MRIPGKGRKERDIPMDPVTLIKLYQYALKNTNDKNKYIFANPKTLKPYTK